MRIFWQPEGIYENVAEGCEVPALPAARHRHGGEESMTNAFDPFDFRLSPSNLRLFLAGLYP